jgi:hypothetical protein
MNSPRKFLIEGLDRLGKDLLIKGLQSRLGYHAIIHCSKPMRSEYYVRQSDADALRLFQVDTFRTMFSILRDTSLMRVIYNRAHLGECVYAPLYRSYSGDYVFDLEREFGASKFTDVRLILLTEEFEVSKHFSDDGKSLGPTDQRAKEQDHFLRAFASSTMMDKRVVNVTDVGTGEFRAPTAILDEVLA